jgi:hypothetical protein
VSHCTKRRLGSNVHFIVSATATRATLVRRGTVFASGASRHGLLVLRSMRPLRAGAYTLTLDYGDHRTTQRVAVA